MCELEPTIEIVSSQVDGMNSERTTISSGIDNILRSCGWDTGNNSEYKREVRLNNNSWADIVLYPEVSSTILIESKKYGRMPEGINSNEWKKFRGYANKLQPCMAIISDSRFWEFYDLINGKMSKYPFFEIDLFNAENKELNSFKLLLGKNGYSQIDLIKEKYKGISTRELIEFDNNTILKDREKRGCYSYIMKKIKETNLRLFIDGYSINGGLNIYMKNLLRSKCYIKVKIIKRDVIIELYIQDKNSGLYEYLITYRTEFENVFNNLVCSIGKTHDSIELSKYFSNTKKESWNKISEYVINVVENFYNVFYEKIKFFYN